MTREFMCWRDHDPKTMLGLPCPTPGCAKGVQGMRFVVAAMPKLPPLLAPPDQPGIPKAPLPIEYERARRSDPVTGRPWYAWLVAGSLPSGFEEVALEEYLAAREAAA